MYTHIHTHTHTYIYIYIHTYTHTYTRVTVRNEKALILKVSCLTAIFNLQS